MRWWTEWNAAAARHADVIVQLEHLPEQFPRILERMGLDDWAHRGEAAVSATMPGVNSATVRGFALPKVCWGDLPDSAAKAELEETADKWGYRVDGDHISAVLFSEGLQALSAPNAR